MSTDLDPTASSDRRWRRSVPWLLLVAFGLLLHGAWVVGPTYDEHFYAAAGHAYWNSGEFSLNREHPPLLKLLAGLPLALMPDVRASEHWDTLLNYPLTFFYDLNVEHVDRNLFLARLPFCLLTVAGGYLVYRAAGRLFGARAGVVALVLFVFNPNVLAHGRLAALDAGAAVAIFAALWAFVEALERPSARRVLFAGVLFGLANLTKFTALLLGPVTFGLALVAWLRARSWRPWTTWVRVVLAGLTVFAAGYGFEMRSINEAWGLRAYTAKGTPEALTPSDMGAGLEGFLRERDADERAIAAARRLAAAPDPTGAMMVWSALIRRGEPASLAEPVAQGFELLVGGPGDLRKRAADVLIDVERERISLETRLDLLPRLAGRKLYAEDGGAYEDPEQAFADWTRWYERHRYDDWDEQVIGKPLVRKVTSDLFGDATPIPLFTAIRGVDFQLAHGSKGHSSYYNGKPLVPGIDFVNGNPHPEYYAHVMLLKNPLAWLALVLGGLAMALWPGGRLGLLPRLAYLGFPLLAFYLFSTGNALMGVRYVLPVFPFLCVLGAGVAALLPRLGVGLAAVALVESLWIHPHELMYYNLPAGGPVGGPEVTVISDDWGQDVRAVGHWLAEHAEEVEAAGGLHYEPYSKAPLEAFGLESVRPPKKNVEGLVAVGAADYYRNPTRYGWLEDFEPFARLGWSVYLFDTRGGPPGRPSFGD
ncbi:MAG: ArnT family glycosyltransferase [Planctomycetota bacterium]|jgi:4-amino-4-deoxy-L-arabinose transferase-like glycosyltransferase